VIAFIVSHLVTLLAVFLAAWVVVDLIFP